jgi:hypothetical protein
VETVLAQLQKEGKAATNFFVALPDGLAIDTGNLTGLTLIEQVKFVLMRQFVMGTLVEQFDLQNYEKEAQVLALQT